MLHPKLKKTVISFAIMMSLYGILLAYFLIVIVLNYPDMPPWYFIGISVWLIVWIICYGYVIRGLYSKKRWAWILGVIQSIIDLFGVLSLFSIIALVGLLNGSVMEEYKSKKHAKQASNKTQLNYCGMKLTRNQYLLYQGVTPLVILSTYASITDSSVLVQYIKYVHIAIIITFIYMVFEISIVLRKFHTKSKLKETNPSSNPVK